MGSQWFCKVLGREVGPEPQAGKPRPVDTMDDAPVTTPGRLEWDFREGLDMVWHDLEIEADAVLGLAGKGAAP